MQKKIVITGGIGSGKSALAKILIQKGYCVWDADAFSREVLFFPDVQARIKSIFGEYVFVSPGVLNRELVRDKIFSSKELKKSFESILHPAMFDLFNSKTSLMASVAPTAWIFYEASLVLELGRKSYFDACVVVTANEDLKISRLRDIRNLPESSARKIISAQMPDKEKITHADFVIDNSSNIQKLEKNAEKMLIYLREKFSS